MKYKYPTGKLTFVISDYGPLMEGEPVSRRTVVIILTPEQTRELRLRQTHTNGGKEFYETISSVILEPEYSIP